MVLCLIIYILYRLNQHYIIVNKLVLRPLQIGMFAEHVKLEASKSQEELLAALDTLNNRKDIHGIILQVTNLQDL